MSFIEKYNRMFPSKKNFIISFYFLLICSPVFFVAGFDHFISGILICIVSIGFLISAICKIKEIILPDYDFLEFCLEINNIELFEKKLNSLDNTTYRIGVSISELGLIDFAKRFINHKDIDFSFAHNSAFKVANFEMQKILIKDEKVKKSVQQDLPDIYQKFLNKVNYEAF